MRKASPHAKSWWEDVWTQAEAGYKVYTRLDATARDGVKLTTNTPESR